MVLDTDDQRLLQLHNQRRCAGVANMRRECSMTRLCNQTYEIETNIVQMMANADAKSLAEQANGRWDRKLWILLTSGLSGL